MTKELAIRILSGDVLCTTEESVMAIAMAVKALYVSDRKVGEWKNDKDGHVWCYECGFGKERSDKRPYRFCPNCGAIME